MQGTKELSDIHDLLYANEFAGVDLGLPYKPHMTIGKLPTADVLAEAYVKVKDLKETFSTVVEKISVEMIGENEESIIVIEKKLG